MANQYKHFKDQGIEVVAVNVGESKIAVHNFMKLTESIFRLFWIQIAKCLMPMTYLRFRQPFNQSGRKSCQGGDRHYDRKHDP